MAKEIERKFLIKGNDWKIGVEGVYYHQGYLSSKKKRVVRIRTIGNTAYVTIKGQNIGATRDEYEYKIPVKDANDILKDLCKKPTIEKYRYKIEYAGLIWEVDEFLGENLGLVLAEVELSDEKQKIELPSWIEKEVTGDPKYYNSNLVAYPYSKWDDD